MDCTRFVEEKADGTDGPEFREHRAGCAACRRDVEDYEEVRELYREASVERFRGRAPRRSGWRWAPAAAAAVFLAGVLVFVLGNPGDRPQVESGIRFVRHVPLEPWAGPDERLDKEMDSVWRRLQRLEGSVE